LAPDLVELFLEEMAMAFDTSGLTDRELVERAAKAAGFSFVTESDGELIAWNGREPVAWNPLLDDAAAFRLAVDRGLDVLASKRLGGDVLVVGERGHARVPCAEGQDRAAAVRRAIVIAAASEELAEN
jgi:hypothetical protein